MKFKVGDRVRVTIGDLRSATGVIVKIDNSPRLPILVQFDGYRLFCSANELEKIK